MGKLSDTVNKFFRSVQREFIGESNVLTDAIFIDMQTGAVIAPPNPNNRLQFEKSCVKIEGSRADVHSVRCLDNMIGNLSSTFSDKAAKKIALHVSDLAGPLSRIKAYKVTEDNRKIPVNCLEYTNTTIKLG